MMGAGSPSSPLVAPAPPIQMKGFNPLRLLLRGGFAARLALLAVVASLLGMEAASAEPTSNETTQASSRLPDGSVAVANNGTLQPRSFMLEHRLQDKTLCLVTLRGKAAGTNILDAVEGVEISLEGCKITLPPGVCSEWKDFDPSSGLQVLETGMTQDVILTGGKQDSRWRAKLTIQNRALVSWQYSPESRLPVLNRQLVLIRGPVIKMTPTPASNHPGMPENGPSNTQDK
jgi:hypothetical protein